VDAAASREPGGVQTVDFAKLYDEHADYTARRREGSFAQAQIALEVAEFKVPNLVRLLPSGYRPRRILEIGCATGELIAGFPVAAGGDRVGVDISASNVETARARFPSALFHAGDFRQLVEQPFDCVILSDVLEHVENDADFLASAANLGRYVLVNLPLEDNWLNRHRAYGPNDVSGHLRKYSIDQGLAMFARAGMRVIDHHRVWVHETPVERSRRELRLRHVGAAFGGSPVRRWAKRAVFALARVAPLFGRRLFDSNLFVIAEKGRIV
jgi:SAM-dependent methyltransferase